MKPTTQCFRSLIFGILLLPAAVAAVQAENESEYAAVAPYVTADTAVIQRVDCTQLNVPSVYHDLLGDAKLLLPRTFSSPEMSELLPKFEEGVTAFQKRLDAVSAVSGGILYVVSGKNGTALVIPRNQSKSNSESNAESRTYSNVDSDAISDAEALIAAIPEDFPFFELEEPKPVVKIGTSDSDDEEDDSEDAADTSFETYTLIKNTVKTRVMVLKRDDAFVLCIPGDECFDVDSMDAGRNNADIVRSAAEKMFAEPKERPEFASAFESCTFGIFSTNFISLQDESLIQGLNELAENAKEDDFPLTSEEIQSALQNAGALTFQVNSFADCSSAQIAFSSEEEAAKALKMLEAVRDFMLEKSAETLEDFAFMTDILRIASEYLKPRQDGNVLMIDFNAKNNEFSSKYFSSYVSFRAYQQKMREERALADPKAEAQRQFDVISPWISDGTQLVVRFNLKQLNPSQNAAAILDAAKVWIPTALETPELSGQLAQLDAALKMVDSVKDLLHKKGIDEAFFVVDLSNFALPVRFILPDGKEHPEKGKCVEFADFVGDALPKELLQEVSEKATLIEWKNSYVILPKTDESVSSDTILESFVEGFKPADVKNIEKLCSGLELNAHCSVSAVFGMNPVAELYINQFVSQMKEVAEYNENMVSIPSAKVLIRGFDVASLGLDPDQGICALNVLSKTEKAAENIQKLARIWRNEFLDLFDEELTMYSEDEPFWRHTVPVDMIDLFRLSPWMPEREGNRLFLSPMKDPRYQLLGAQLQNTTTQIAVAGVAAGLLLPSVSQARGAARRMQTMNFFKQCALAMLNYESDHGSFPPAYTVDEDGKPLHSWRVLILPYLEQNELYEKIRLDEPWDSEWNRQFHEMCPAAFRSVYEPESSKAVIGVVVGKGGVFEPVTSPDEDGTDIDDITDGTSNTILLVNSKPVNWMDPTSDISMEDACRPWGGEKGIPFLSPKEHEIIAAFVDGSVRFIKDGTFECVNFREFLTRDADDAVDFSNE